MDLLSSYMYMESLYNFSNYKNQNIDIIKGKVTSKLRSLIFILILICLTIITLLFMNINNGVIYSLLTLVFFVVILLLNKLFNIIIEKNFIYFCKGYKFNKHIKKVNLENQEYIRFKVELNKSKLTLDQAKKISVYLEQNSNKKNGILGNIFKPLNIFLLPALINTLNKIIESDLKNIIILSGLLLLSVGIIDLIKLPFTQKIYKKDKMKKLIDLYILDNDSS